MFTPQTRKLIDSDRLQAMDWVARHVGGVADAQTYRARVERVIYDNLWDAVACARLHGLTLSRFVKLVRAEWTDQEREDPEPGKLGPHEEVGPVWDGHD
jgi:hypothetical protein